MTVELSGATTTFVPADSERRFHAFLIDRLLALVVCAPAAYVAVTRSASVLVGAALVLATVAVVWLAGALMTGLAGASPGKRVTGLRVVDAVDGQRVGVRRALLRHGIVGALTLPTAGLGAAVLAWTATSDPSGRRRGLHDRVVATVVLDARRPVVATRAEVAAPSARLVNLTALRLRPNPPDAQRSRRPAAPMRQRPAHPPAAGKAWRVAFDTGETFVVSGLALVGTDPQARPGERVARRVTLATDDLSLSATHLQFDVTPQGSLVVMDTGSATGSTLVRQGARRSLAAGRPTTLVDGDRVRLGDREMLVRRAA